MIDAVLAIDQGTSNTKVLLVGAEGELLAQSSRPLSMTHPRPGWTEQSPVALWDSVKSAIDEVVGKQPDVRVVAIGISNQRETTITWDRISGEPVAPAIIWQCRRTSQRCADLRAAGHAGEIADRTGLGIDPLFPAAKIEWLLDNVPDCRSRAERGELICGTVDSWLLWNLTGGASHATDHSNASRTQLLNLDAAEWDEQMLALFHIPRSILPEIRSSDALFGLVAAGQTALPEGIPVHAIMGDSHAALFGHGFRKSGEAKVTLGTGSSLMVLTPQRVRSSHGLSSTIAWSRGGEVQNALEGNISVSGRAAAFATNLLGLKDEGELTALALTVGSSDGVTFVPALAGLGAPYWRDEVRGQLSGMSLGTTPAHIAYAALEGIALQIYDVFTAMEADLGTKLPSLSVDGGASKNDLLMQFIANLVDCPVLRPPITDASALGAAHMAWAALGRKMENGTPVDIDRFEPKIAASTRAEIVTQWHGAIGQAMATISN